MRRRLRRHWREQRRRRRQPFPCSPCGVLPIGPGRPWQAGRPPVPGCGLRDAAGRWVRETGPPAVHRRAGGYGGQGGLGALGWPGGGGGNAGRLTATFDGPRAAFPQPGSTRAPAGRSHTAPAGVAAGGRWGAGGRGGAGRGPSFGRASGHPETHAGARIPPWGVGGPRPSAGFRARGRGGARISPEAADRIARRSSSFAGQARMKPCGCGPANLTAGAGTNPVNLRGAAPRRGVHGPDARQELALRSAKLARLTRLAPTSQGSPQTLPNLRIGIMGSDSMKNGLALKLYEPLSPPLNQLQIHTVSYQCVSQISLFLKLKVTPDHQPLPVTSTFYKLLLQNCQTSSSILPCSC